MLHIHQLNYQIKSKTLLNNIDLSIKPGELIAIVGPNGAGKSTLLSSIANELKYEAKTFQLKKKNISNFSGNELPFYRAKFSQHHAAEINLKISEIVLMGRYPYFSNEPSSTDWEIVEKWMQKTETKHLEDREYEQLSGGEKQRLHLSRVFAQLENNINEKLLLLDEPLNNLDVAHQFKTLHLIQAFTKKNNAALVVLHDLNIASQFADRLLLLNKGSIEIFDIPQKVLTQQRISKVYQYPCTIIKHPITQLPIILFG